MLPPDTSGGALNAFQSTARDTLRQTATDSASAARTTKSAWEGRRNGYRTYAEYDRITQLNSSLRTLIDGYFTEYNDYPTT